MQSGCDSSCAESSEVGHTAQNRQQLGSADVSTSAQADNSTESPHADKRLDRLCANTLRFLAVDMIEQAKSGHPGLPPGSATMLYMLAPTGNVATYEDLSIIS